MSGQIKWSPRNRSSWPAPARGHTPAPTPGLNPSPQKSHKPSCLRLSAQGFHSSSQDAGLSPRPSPGCPQQLQGPTWRSRKGRAATCQVRCDPLLLASHAREGNKAGPGSPAPPAAVTSDVPKTRWPTACPAERTLANVPCALPQQPRQAGRQLRSPLTHAQKLQVGNAQAQPRSRPFGRCLRPPNQLQGHCAKLPAPEVHLRLRHIAPPCLSAPSPACSPVC